MPKHSPPNHKRILAFAKSLRKNMTEEERILWVALRKRSLNFRFRRQYIIGSYIADFVCLEKMLVIELDGYQHFTEQAQHYDQKRTAIIETQGFRVIRFTNAEIRHNLVGVLDTIYFYLTGEM